LSDDRTKPSSSVCSKLPNYSVKQFNVLSFILLLNIKFTPIFRRRKQRNRKKLRSAPKTTNKGKRWERNFLLPSFLPSFLLSFKISFLCVLWLYL
jgi:hypothetical protein